MAFIEVKQLSKVYEQGNERVVALDDVSLSIEKGEFVAIVGASGSGKSTLIHMLGCVDRPTQGVISIDGVDVSTLKDTPLTIFRRRHIGLVYQFYNLIPTLDVADNIKLPILLDGASVDQTYYQLLLEHFQLEDRISHLPSQLSGGQQQRVSVARALMNRPFLLLLDEPTGNLDQKTSAEIMDQIKTSHKLMNQTIVLITHDPMIAQQADRIIEISDGSIIVDEVIV